MKTKNKNLLMLFSFLLFIFLTIAFTACKKTTTDTSVPAGSPEWNYENTSQWGTFPGDAECTGKVESPVSIDTNQTIRTHYTSPLFTKHYKNSNWGIINNGHTIQVNIKQSNYILLNRDTAFVKQFHFHKHSEHQLSGDTSDMEMHIVHQENNGDITVLAVFLKKDPTNLPNPFISKLWNNFPIQKNQEITSIDSINLINGLPLNQTDFYNYTGSLTTPPCTQGVNWIIYKHPVYVSFDQIQKFDASFHKNYRALQPLNNRQVIESY